MSTTIRTDTIRKALADLRAMLADARSNGDNDVDVGRALPTHVVLDDGTTLEIGLVPASDGGLLMGVYQAVRMSRNGERLAKHMI